jgi:hypothetical protein
MWRQPLWFVDRQDGYRDQDGETPNGMQQRARKTLRIRTRRRKLSYVSDVLLFQEENHRGKNSEKKFHYHPVVSEQTP